MTQPLRITELVRETISGTRQIVLPSLPWLFLFAFVAGYRAWSEAAMPAGQAYLFLDFVIVLGVIYTGCLFSAVMYRTLLHRLNAPLRRVALRLGLANILLYIAALIILFILALFLSIFSGVMIGLTDYDPSNTNPSDIANSMSALRESGGVWPLYILLACSVAGFFWFALRMILFGVGTVAENKVIVFQSWGWTKGHVLKIAGLAILLQVAVFVVFFVIGEGLTAALGYPSTLALTFTDESTFSIEFGDAVEAGITPLQYGIGTGIRTLILAPFWWLGHALAVVLYRRLAPVDQLTTPASSS